MFLPPICVKLNSHISPTFYYKKASQYLPVFFSDYSYYFNIIKLIEVWNGIVSFIFKSFEILHHIGMIETGIYGKETRTQYVDELVMIRN
ncbi:hypothetical protein CN907_01055 [Bacillus anthracis]|nr:hypothetical protein CN907_01055 [Bacillus anthracis]